ncbi:hypothetical protein JCM18899A_38060 [Nocardioides sp. AN3]
MKSSANRSLPVLLVPGRPGTALLWAPLRVALAETGTTAVHLVGHGRGGELVRRLVTAGPLASVTATDGPPGAGAVVHEQAC